MLADLRSISCRPFLTIFPLLSLCAAGAQPPQAQPVAGKAAQLVIDLTTNTGPVLHGGSGWLYGQSAPGVPSVNMMEPLHPQISAQKPDGGLQHPMADASLVAPDFRAAGGRLMQIYMQDIYPDWTYNDLGIDDYLHKVDAMTRQIAADPNHDLFVYVPFNEPNNNWYADNGPKFTKFLHDWMLVYREIHSIDPNAKIAGPGFEHFNGAAFEAFLLFARDNHVLPDEFTWHELHDDFFPDWYRRVDSYRASEAKLGIGPLPIVINEYARDRGDLAVPGNLVQWLTRFEDSKVYGCLAFWTPSGTLADLTARIWPNRPTGAWWLYQWYGSLTGSTVKVTPPDPNAVGLQGVASIDTPKQQVRVIFGGTAKPIELTLHGIGMLPAYKDGVHVRLSRIGSSGVEPSPNPEQIADTNKTISANDFNIAVPASTADAAYLLILTPSLAQTSEARTEIGAQEIMAVDADFNGQALYSRPEGSAVSLGGQRPGASVRFIASAPSDGFYLLHLRLKADALAGLRLVLDDGPTRRLETLPNAGKDWTEQRLRLFLSAGVHRFRFSIADEKGVRIHSLTLVPSDGLIALYQAAAAQNTLGGTAHKVDISGAPSHEAVAGIGGGSANFLEFRRVQAESSGRYAVIVKYANDEKGHNGQVDERTDISVNGGPAQSTWFRNTFAGDVFATAVINVDLKAGKNRIRFSNASGRAPVIESIRLARQEQ